MKNERVEWIDISKGIAVILVLLGHTQSSQSLVAYIFSFHMPFFFFISGYLFNMDKYTSLIYLIKAKAKSILIPYVAFSGVSLILYSVIFDYHINDWYLVIKVFLESKRNGIFYNVPLWFFTTLFLVEVLYFIIRKYINYKVIVLIILIISGYIESVLFNSTGQPKLLWSFDLAIYYSVFFGMGNIGRGVQLTNRLYKKVILTILLLINILLLVNPEVFNVINRFGFSHKSISYLWSLVLGFSGIVLLVVLSKYLNFCKPLAYLGKNTLIIFSLHFVLGYNLINVFVLTYKIPIVPSNITGFIYVSLELLILIPVVNIINKYFPFLLAKPRTL